MQYALILISVILGVASFSAIKFVNTSLLSHFRKSVDSVTTQGMIPIWSVFGVVPVDLYSKIKSVDGVQGVVPILEQQFLHLATDLPVKVVSLDLIELGYALRSQDQNDASVDEDIGNIIQAALTRSHVLLASRRVVDKLGGAGSVALYQSGKKFVFELLEVNHLVEDTGLVLYSDISQAPQLIDNPQSITRFEAMIDSQVREQVLDDIKSVVPDSVTVGANTDRYQQGAKLVESFQINLLSLSLVSLLVGFFIILLSVSLGFHQRLRELSLLLALGVTKIQIAAVLFLESLILGGLGGVLGIPLGLLLSRLMIVEASKNVSRLYFAVVADVVPEWLDVAMGVGVGVVATMMATVFVLVRLTEVSPNLFFKKDIEEVDFAVGKFKIAAFGVLFLLLSGLCHAFTSFERPYLSFVTCFFFVLAVVGLLPMLLSVYFKGIAKFTRGFLVHTMANFDKYLFRYAQVLSALVIAFALVFSILHMTASFRKSLLVWVDGQFRADIYISNVDAHYRPYESVLPETLMSVVREDQRVKQYYTITRQRITYRDRSPVLTVTDTKQFLDQFFSEELIRISGLGVPVAASENFMIRHDLKIGSEIKVALNARTVALQIVSIFKDFTNEDGQLVLDAKHASALGWQRLQPQLMHIYLKEGINVETTIEDFKNQLSGYELKILSHGTLRELIIEVLDQTFVLADALKWISLIVALVGLVINMLLMTDIRTVFFSMLRVLGLNRTQTLVLLLIENCIVIAFALLAGYVVSFGLVYILVYGIQKYYFSWVLSLAFEHSALGFLVAGLIVLSLILSMIFSRRIHRIPLGVGVRYE